MSVAASKIAAGSMVSNGASITETCRIVNSFAMSVQHTVNLQKIDIRRASYSRLVAEKLSVSSDGLSSVFTKPSSYGTARENLFVCHSRGGLQDTETKECTRLSDKVDDISEQRSSRSSVGLADIGKFVYNDMKYVNERARNDFVLLSRGIMKLNDRACQDVAVLGVEFLKLDARAREDTEKIDHGVKKKAESLHHIATILQDKAQSKLKRAADKHWNDGALEADLRRADLLAKRRAMEDAFTALEFVKDIHDMMVSKMYNLPLRRKQGSVSANDMMSIMLEKNGKSFDFLSAGLTADRITAVQEAYESMASALSEADGIDYTDPDEIELVVATLIDLDAMDSKRSVSLLVDCSSSPDVETRQALANALATAPSIWTLGNAGMGALKRLAEDSNPSIASAASKAIAELKKQWEIVEGDSLRFTMNQKPIDVTETDIEDEDTE